MHATNLHNSSRLLVVGKPFYPGTGKKGAQCIQNKMDNIEKPQRCLGLSDPKAASPRRAEILNVTFKSIAVGKHNYTVSWKPLENFPFLDGGNLTHYSLLYEFEHNPTSNRMMSCVLVPRVSKLT
ncbi:uncharacterized protein LOC110044527 [Orbicella faveolata]|uniref:uncharacterized protein LOC110044527 n=1 Tax=Orbicella faveolata TaxID=48498 RepID=UPI0009E3963E|nr:uncharacterized protein LOC110044527 [Orbicella faveolata]